MSNWDFGHPPAGQDDPPQPPESEGAADPPSPAAGAAEGWGRDERWAIRTAGAGHETWRADDAWPGDQWDDDDGAAPYPVTYERDPFVAPVPQPAPPPDSCQRAPSFTPIPQPATPPDGYQRHQFAACAPPPPTPQEPYGRGPSFTPNPQAAAPTAGKFEPWSPAPGPGAPGDADEWTGRGQRWLIPAAIVAAAAVVGAATVLLSGGHPASPASGQSGQHPDGRTASASPAGKAGSTPGTSPSPGDTSAGAPLTMAQAQAVLGAYTTANNDANAERSDTLLGEIETGSSYTIDAGLYQTQRATGAAPYPPFSAAQATYYIPGSEPASGPRWFVAQVGDAFQSSPQRITSTEYLLFTQSVAGGAWQDAIEPYLLSAASAPRIAVGADGLATAVSQGAASVAVAPGRLAAVTAASLDGTQAGQTAIADPGNLADRDDQRSWQAMMPGGTVTDAHSPVAGPDGQEFALLTADGGALVFYTDAAQVTVTPPAGSPLHLSVPGLYAAGQALTEATVSYLEQFAAYDPPAGTGVPRIVADYSAITGGS